MAAVGLSKGRDRGRSSREARGAFSRRRRGRRARATIRVALPRHDIYDDSHSDALPSQQKLYDVWRRKP